MTKKIFVEPIDRFYKGYALDLDGTIYLGDQLLEGAQEVISTLREKARVVFVTNKPLETAQSYATKLTGLGIPTESADIVTPLDSLVDYLNDNWSGAVVLTVAETLVDDVLRNAGFEVTGDPLAAGVVVVSFDRTFTYAKLFAAYKAVNNGAVIIATNPDPFCPTPEGGLPDCAAMLAAVEACTGVRAEAIVGKPSEHMGRAILARMNVAPTDAVMVGDRLLTDIAMGCSLGMTSVLILTGVSSLEDIRRSGIQPDFVVDKLLDLLPSGQDSP